MPRNGTVSPPECPDGQSYRTAPSSGCYESETYYDSRPYDYSCPSTSTLGTSGGSRTCTKTETYRQRVCSFDPIAGQQYWWETRTRTLTAAVIESCASGYSADGTGCTANSPSTRWVAMGSTPTRYRYDPATRSCLSGWSDNGSQCESDTASTRWDPTGSTPVTSRTGQADRSCDTGFTWSGSSGKCENTTYTDPTAPLTTVVGDPPAVSCPDGYAPAGGGPTAAASGIRNS
ncbi:hypothetical protein [Candidatus Poriferisodalis sp.]|uniref:hypothetical protein n=1 Tax=Candidatus Poriferisodalis sp. TaxID=3101277 RepID=UPI003D0A8E2D